MPKETLFLIFLFTGLKLSAQIDSSAVDTTTFKSKVADVLSAKDSKSKVSNNNIAGLSLEKLEVDYGWSDRFAFIVGGGFNYALTPVYHLPTITPDSNLVVINQASNLRPNLTLGIIFTPYLVITTRKIPIGQDENGDTKYTTIYNYYPKGISFALFMNPINFSNISGTNAVDIGLGLGYRTSDFSILATFELYVIKQPSHDMINNYLDKRKPYIINGEIQTSLDLNHDAIATLRTIPTLGIKMAYNFDIVKSFNAGASKD